jgi:iron(III) transport system permease protein
LRLADAMAIIFLIAFLLVPLGTILLDSIRLLARGGVGEIPGFADYLVRLTRNSLVLAALVTVVCVAAGIPLAVIMARVLPDNRALALGLTLPLLAPPFVSAFATILLFGRVGVVTQLLARVGIHLPDIYGLPGIVITHVMHLIPLASLTIAAGLRTVPKAIEESAISLGSSAFQVLARVVVPYVSAHIYMAGLLVFLASFGDVGAPLLVGGQYLVLPTEAFTRFVGFLADRRVPVLLSAWIVAISMAMMVGVRALMRRTVIVHTHVVETYAYDLPRWRALGSVVGWLAAAALCAPFVVIFISSVATVWGPDLLPRALTFDHYRALWRSIGPLQHSLIVTGIAAPTAVLLAIAIGRMIRSGGRLAAALDYVTSIPFVVSGVVLGIGLVRTYAPLEAAGVLAPALWGPGLLVAALISRRLPYPVRVLNAAYMRVDRSLEECSASLGAPPATTFLRITFPQLIPAVLAALIITFIQVVRELGATLIVHRPGWATLPVQIYAYAVEGHLGRAGALSMVLLALVAIATALASRLGEGRARRGMLP